MMKIVAIVLILAGFGSIVTRVPDIAMAKDPEIAGLCHQLSTLRPASDPDGARTMQYSNRLSEVLRNAAKADPKVCEEIGVQLVRKWGRVGICFDLAVMRVLRDGYPFMRSECVCREMLERIRDEPRLLEQLFWENRWSDGAKFDNIFGRVPLDVAEKLSTGEMFYVLAFQASALNMLNVIDEMRFSDVECAFFKMQWRVERLRPFLAYDSSSAHYVCDWSAMKNGRPLSAEYQRWQGADCPLPGWK